MRQVILFLNFGPFKTALKKLVAILSLCCLFLNIIGYHVIFYIRQAEIKTEMKKLLLQEKSNKEQTILIFSLNDENCISKLEWEDDEEFRLNGEMYDVVEKKIEDGKLIIRCISDKKETALISKFEKMNKENNSKSKSALLIKLISSTYLPAENTEQFKKVISVPSTIDLQSKIISRAHDVLTPPPQVS
jgi:hypothetical protein